MFKILLERFRQKYRTSPFPKKKIHLPAPYRGLPFIHPKQCSKDCQKCLSVCPTKALSKNESGEIKLDLARCLFCLNCEKSCTSKAIQFTQHFELATNSKKDLELTGEEIRLAKEFDEKILKLFGRSLKLRQVSAGGCNACEADCNVLGTPFFDLGRFGVQFVASPRHADGLLVTGPVTENMKVALKKTYEALPNPKIVIAVGACALSGGIFRDHNETNNGVDTIIPVDLYIPGCPPHPLTILDGILRVLGKIPKE